MLLKLMTSLSKTIELMVGLTDGLPLVLQTCRKKTVINEDKSQWVLACGTSNIGNNNKRVFNCTNVVIRNRVSEISTLERVHRELIGLHSAAKFNELRCEICSVCASQFLVRWRVYLFLRVS